MCPRRTFCASCPRAACRFACDPRRSTGPFTRDLISIPLTARFRDGASSADGASGRTTGGHSASPFPDHHSSHQRYPRPIPLRRRRSQRGRQTIARWSGSCRVAGARGARGRANGTRSAFTMAVGRPVRADVRCRLGAPQWDRARVPRGSSCRRVDPGVPSLERIGEAIGAAPGLRTMIETKLARAQRLTANLEREALARAIASGRTTVLIAIDSGTVALRQTSHGLRLPAGEGQGESACRHLLQETLGSGVGDLSFLGTVPGVGTIRLLDIWVARRIRLDRAMTNEVVWVPPRRARGDRGRPRTRGCRNARRNRVRAPLWRCTGAGETALASGARPGVYGGRHWRHSASRPRSQPGEATRGCLRSPKISALRYSSDSVSSPSSAPISMNFSWSTSGA